MTPTLIFQSKKPSPDFKAGFWGVCGVIWLGAGEKKKRQAKFQHQKREGAGKKKPKSLLSFIINWVYVRLQSVVPSLKAGVKHDCLGKIKK